MVGKHPEATLEKSYWLSWPGKGIDALIQNYEHFGIPFFRKHCPGARKSMFKTRVTVQLSQKTIPSLLYSRQFIPGIEVKPSAKGSRLSPYL